MQNGKSLISIFQEFSSSISKAFILAGRIGWGLSFYVVWAVFRYFLISWHPKSLGARQLLRQLVYTMFIGNNRTSLHLWWKESLVKHRKVSFLIYKHKLYKDLLSKTVKIVTNIWKKFAAVQAWCEVRLHDLGD